MATIEIGNLYSKLSDASTRGLMHVDEALAVSTPGYSFTTQYRQGLWDGKTRFFKAQSGRFPSGLLSEVVVALKKAGDEVDIVDDRKHIEVDMPEEIKLAHKELGHITLRDYQYESVKKSIEASRGVVNVATNGGKTEIAAGIIQTVLPALKSGQKIAFFTHSKEIFTQSHKRLEERLGIKVGRIGNGKWEEEQVSIVMIPTISRYLSDKKIPKNIDADKFKESFKKTKKLLSSINMFIADEVHHASSDTWYKLFMKLKNCYFRFGLTGTVDESNEINVKRLLGCTGRIVTKVSNEFLIEKGYSAKPTIYMMPVNADPISNRDYSEARKMGIILNDKRNYIFAKKVLERANSGKQCLIIVNETEHGDIVTEMLKKYKCNVEFTHGEMSSKFREDALERFKNGEIQVLVATSILDEGVDVSGINCLFLMAGGKSMRQLLQRIGRGLRKKEDGSGIEVYDALDYHNEYLVDHTLERYNTYKAEGFDIVKL